MTPSELAEAHSLLRTALTSPSREKRAAAVKRLNDIYLEQFKLLEAK